jgi:hypothetical protein
VRFAGVLVALGGCMNVIYGIAALRNSKIFPAHAEVVISSLHTWGWAAVILGGLQILAAVGIFAGNQLARWFGVLVLFVSSIGQLSMASAYPIWSLTIFGLEVLAIYALVVHGRATAPE